MSYWLVESRPLSLESPSESNDDDESEDVSDEDVVSESRSDCSKEYDDDDFDNKSLEIDEEERSKISAQINPDEDEDDDDTEEEKETIPEKEDSEQEKHQDEPSVSRTSLRSTFDDDLYQGQAVAAGLDEGETSMTESAENRTTDIGHIIQKLDLERKRLEQELEMDEQHRQFFYNKLRTITHKMESLQSLQSSQNGLVHTDTAIHQLEMEAYQVQRAMEEKLGLGEAVRLRQQGLKSRIQTIESEISSLMGRARKASREMLVSDVSPVLPASDAYRVSLNQENSEKGCAPERASAQTGLSPAVDLRSGNSALVSSVDGVAAGIPLGYNHLSLYHKSWTGERRRSSSSPGLSLLTAQDNAGSISFNSHSSGSPGMMSESSRSSMFSLANSTDDQSQQMGAKVEMVYSLLSILGSHDKDDMARTLFAMSQSLDSCLAMRQSGCLPLLLQLLHGNEKDPGLLGRTRGSKAARSLASAALHNIVHCHHDDKRGRREARTLRLLEQIRAHCDQQRGESDDESEGAVATASSSSNYSEMDHHPGAAIAALMKLSFDEDYRHAICTLGGLQAIAELLEMENKAATPLNDYSTTIRRYSCMALTNLTFGDGKNKALLCSMRGSLEALTDQLRSTNEDLIQAAASVLRNLSWRADLASKKALREIGAVTTLMRAAMSVKKETTLKSILSALWNLSSHCSENKAEICAVEGALQFLVSLLTYKSTAKTLAIIENGGGILRNVSSQIATREDYRQILRKQDCLKILLFHLKSPSLTIVSNACGTLWNLSARCEEDQNALREMDAISMLRNLVHSRHKMISSGSSAALKNLLSSIPAGKSLTNDRSTGSPRPSLHVRKQRALEAELDHNLSETCDNVDSPRNSPTEIVHRSESEPRRFVYHLNGGGGHRYDEDTRKHMTRRQMMPRNYVENVNNFETDSAGRSGSQDSVGSTHSDISHDRARTRSMLARSSQLLNRRQGHSLDRKGHQMGMSSSTLQPTHPANVASGYKIHADQSTSSSIKSAHDIPSHMYQPFSVTPHQGWLTLPNNHSSPYMHDAAVSTDTDLPAPFQSQPLLTQSTPSNNSRSFHCHDVPSSKPQHSTLLERLAKPSLGLSSSCNLNYSITAANSSLYSISDYTGHQTVASTASEVTDQPVNYSLNYQHDAGGTGDGKPRANKSMHMSWDHLTPATKTSPMRAGGDGDIKLPANKNMHMSCDQLTPATKTPLMRAGAHGESFRACMNSSMNDSTFLNNSFIQDKASGNKSDAVLGDICSMNPTAQVLHKPVPNLVHNQFYNQHGYQTVAAQASLPHCTSPRMSCSSNSSFGTSDYHHSPNHPHNVLGQSLPLCTAATGSGSASQEALFLTGAEQFHTLQAAHQNASHIYPTHQFTGCPEPELDTNLDQPVDFGFTSSGASEDSPYEDCQEQPINYSVRFSEKKSRQDTKAMSSKILSQDRKATSHELKTNQDKQQHFDYRISGSKNIDVISSDNIQTHQIKGTFPLSGVTTFKPTNSYNRSNHTMDENNEDDGVADEADAKLEDTDHDVGAQDAEISTSRPEPHATALISSTGTSDEVNMCHEKKALASFTRQSSVRSLHCTEIEQTDGQPDRSSFEEKVEEADLPSKSSSEESLSSLEVDTTGNPHLVDYRQKTAKSASSNPIKEPAAAEFQNPLTRELIRCLPITPRSSNIITKKPLSLDKVHNSPKSESFVSFTAFNEEDKPISFATRNQDMSLKHTFPGFDEAQPLDFSSSTREQEIPHLTFSTFQKNFQPPLSNQNNHHNNRLVTPRAKTMPTLIEQTAESEPVLGKSEFVELSSEEDSNSDLEEEDTSQNRSSLSQISSKEKDTKLLHNMQQQVLTPNLPEVKETRSGSQVVLNFDTHIFDEAEHIRQMSDRIRQLLAEQQTQDSSGSSVSDISEEDEARGVPATTGIPLPLPPDQRVGQKPPDISTPKKKSGIPMKTNIGALKMPSSLPKTRATAVVDVSPPVDTRKVSGTVCEQLKKSQLHSEESNMIRHYKYDENFDSSSDNSDDNEDNKHRYLSSFSHDESNLQTLKNGSGMVESPEIYSLEKSSQNLSGKNLQKDSASASESPRNASTGLSRIPKAGKIPRSEVKANVINQGMINLAVPAQAKQRLSIKANQATDDSLRQLTSTGIQEGGADQANEMEDLSYDDSLSKVHEAIEALARNSQARPFVGDKGKWEHENKTSTSMYQTKLGQLKNETTSLEEHQNVTDKSSVVVYEGQRVQFIVGDKPLCLSRTSSPSSLSSGALSRKHEQSPELSEYDMRYSSSCASLSKDQDFDEIPSEQVLLEQCRDSALLKPRLPLDPDKARKLTRTMFLGQKGTGVVTANRLSKSASVEMISEYHSGSEPDQDSTQSSLSQEQSSFENLMTRSCSDTAELVLNLQVPPSSSWQTKCSTWHQHLLQCQMDGSDGSYQVTGPYLRIITPEETDRLLVENVNLIMSEIQTTKLSGSSVDEDLFIENETISLVSNGYTSDTNSEVSATWSAVSDKTTDLSSATVTGNQIQVPSSNRVNGPRVLKPIMDKGITKRASVEEDGVKILRGRRKPLYPGKPNNATTAVKGSVKAVAPPVVRGGTVSAGNKRTVQNTVVKSDSGQAILGLKKTPPKNLTVVQPPPKTAPAPGNKNPVQRNVNQRSRSAGPATTPRKNGISSPVTANVNKAGAKGMTVLQATSSANRTNTAKAVGRAGIACNKSNLQSSTNTSTGNSKIPTGSTITPSHSRLPGANTYNKNNNNVAVNNIINKSGWKGTRSASSNTLSNVANEKKTGQNLSKVVNSPSAIPTSNKKGTESGFPKRRSSGSLSSLTSADPGKCGAAGNQGPGRAASSTNADTNQQVQSGNTEPNKCNVDPASKSGIADSNRHTSPSNIDTSKRIKYGNRNTKIATPNNDPKRCSSPNNIDPNKPISSISSDNGKSILSNKIDQGKVSSTGNTNRRVTAGSTDSGKNPSDSNKNATPGNLDPGKRSSLGNTESTKRSPPGSADASKSSQAGNVDSSRPSPSGNSDLNKPTLPGNTDANKNTPTGIPGRRQVTSKIATLWKRDSPPSKGSPRSSTSSPSSRLPVSSMTKTTPTCITRSNMVPPPGFKKKAATLPNSSLASSKTRAAGHGISKSSTYEKISSELQGHDKKLINRSVDAIKKTLKSAKSTKQNNSSSESEESFGKRGKIFELFSSDDDSDDAMEITRTGVKTRINSSLDPSDSVENVFEEQPSVVHTDIQVTINSASDSAGSLDQIGDIGGQIDSSTFRKKKRDPCISDFDLPNADETCRSAHSFTNSFGSAKTSRTSLSSYKNSLNVDSIFNEMNIISFLHSEASDTSLDKKNKHTEEKSGVKAKSLVAQGLKRLFSGRQKEKEKESKTKSTNRESSKTKHAKSNGKEKRSGRDKREYDFFRSNIKIEPSTTWTLDDKLEYDLDSDIMSSTKSIPLRIENHSVTPTVMTAISQSAINTLYGDYEDGSCNGNSSNPEKHMTKTEMLLARRRKNTLQSSSCEDSCGDDNLVTTV